MRDIGQIRTSAPSPLTPGAGSASSSSALLGTSSAAAFQKASSQGATGSFSRWGATGLAAPTLSSQTTSTLLQEQDITQTEVQGGGGGHSGGHGGMKMARNIEAEVAAGTEEAEHTRKRKKLTKLGQRESTKETEDLDEDGLPITKGADEPETSKPSEKGIGDWGWL